MCLQVLLRRAMICICLSINEVSVSDSTCASSTRYSNKLCALLSQSQYVYVKSIFVDRKKLWNSWCVLC